MPLHNFQPFLALSNFFVSVLTLIRTTSLLLRSSVTPVSLKFSRLSFLNRCPRYLISVSDCMYKFVCCSSRLPHWLHFYLISAFFARTTRLCQCVPILKNCFICFQICKIIFKSKSFISICSE